MNFKAKKLRYKVYSNDTLLGEGVTIADIAKIVGCSVPMLFKTRNTEDNTFIFGGVEYTIIDKLDLV